MKSKKDPKVSLVGAGPGSSDLITLRGLRVLRQADVVLYDALVNTELLEEIEATIPRIFAGKRSGKHTKTQDEINIEIVDNANKYGHVVRLKGGDPFVFGRASEEIQYVESHGIPVQVIPGITSALSVPASQGIPVTKRGVSSSFWVMTATKKDGSFSEDLVLASQSSATLIILMGIRKFIEIMKRVGEHRNNTTPVAIIQNGTLPNESCILGTIKNASKMIEKMDATQHGIIVVGNVISEHPSFFEDEVRRVLHTPTHS